jgi:hypothetical protein
LEGGLDTIQILVIVLIVAAQGVGAARAWFRKLKQRREQEEARMGLPGRGGIYDSSEPEIPEPPPPSAELPDWDPYEDEYEEEHVPNGSRPAEAEAPPPPVAQAPARPVSKISSVSLPATPQVLPSLPPLPQIPAIVPSYDKRVDTKRSSARLPGGINLRNAILAKEILDRPLSARRPGGSAAKR